MNPQISLLNAYQPSLSMLIIVVCFMSVCGFFSCMQKVDTTDAESFSVDFEGIRVHYTSYGKGEEAVAMRPSCLSRTSFPCPVP